MNANSRLDQRLTTWLCGVLFPLLAMATVSHAQTPGEVLSHQKISDTAGGFTGGLDNNDFFGVAAAALGDLDGDGVTDLAVGAIGDDDGGTQHGAVWIFFLNNDGTVKSHQKISDTAGGFTGTLDNNDVFGRSFASLGDLDGDGVGDLAVGAEFDDDGSFDAGAVWVLFLNTDGTVKANQKISNTQGGFTGTLQGGDMFGDSLASPGDLDGDGVADLVVGANGDNDGGADRGAAWVLFLNTNGTVKSHQKISDTQGGFTGTLDNGDQLGRSVASLGDLDGDGVTDLAVGAQGDDDGGPLRGAVWILFLNSDGTVSTHQKISDTEGGFGGILQDADFFGQSVASLGDIDSDGVSDLAVGALGDDDGGFDVGAVWVLFLNTDGTAKSHQKISETEGGFTGMLDDSDGFALGVASVGDLDGDGVGDLAVGALADDDEGTDRGAVWILFLEGIVSPEEQIEQLIVDLQAIVDANPGTPLADKLEDALASVETGLDELTKEPPDNQAAVGNMEGAVGSICDAVVEEGLDPVQGTQLMDKLAGIARQLAVEAIDEAIAAGGDQDAIDEAEVSLIVGDALRELGNAGVCEAFKDAVNFYKDALAKAEGALP